MMTEQKLLEILDMYERKLSSSSIKNQYPTLAHNLGMIPKIRDFILEGDKREKVMRWLGFMQGVFYVEGVYTIDEMKKHNMPDEEK